MTSAAIVTIIAAVLVVLALAVFLIAIGRALVGIDQSLGTVIGAVGEIATRTEPVEYVVDSLNANLGKSSDLLTGLLVSKVGSDGAAALVASVDPLGQLTPGPAPGRTRYERASTYGSSAEREPAPQPAPAASEADEPREPFQGGGGGAIRFGGRPS